jgi:class 3 adenylate cyclase
LTERPFPEPPATDRGKKRQLRGAFDLPIRARSDRSPQGGPWTTAFDFVGDSFLAEFPSALDATGCALEIQRAVDEENRALPEERRMLFRLGVHVGDVTARGGRIYGDGVNVAARLEALAEPGGICVSAVVHEEVEGKVRATHEDLGEREVKNIPRPIRVYRLRR